MKVEIKEKTEEPLLSRQRIVADVSFTGAVPSRENIKKDIASQMKAQAELVEVQHIYPSFGIGNAKILAFVYKDKKAFDLLKKQKGKKKKAKKEGEAKEEGAEEPEEKSKEEKSE